MTTTTFSLTDFFARHFPDLGADERIEIRAFPQQGGPARQSWHADALSAARAALTLPQELAIFFGTNARVDRGGKKADVTKVRALHSDIDSKLFADGREGALRTIEAFPLAPTVVVESGNGFHCYWFLTEAVEPSAAIEQLLLRLYSKMGETEGVRLDPVQDLGRVMRVPETFNTKTTPAKLVRVYTADYERIYRLADFEALLPAPVEPERVAWTPPTNGGGRSAYDDVPSIAEMREILRFIPPGGDYTADWLRILAAVHSVYPGPEGEGMCAEWCDGKPGEIAKKFASFKRDGNASDAASVGTLIHIAKQHGYEPPRRTQASPKFTMPPPEMSTNGDTLNGLEMAEALDTARRENAELRDKLSRCREEHLRKDATIESLDLELRAYKAAAAFPDQTMGGAVWDVANGAFAERERGNVLVEDGKEQARVCYQTAADLRSCATVGNATKKFVAAGAVAGTFRKIEVETEAFKGKVQAAYIEIPPECDTPAKFVLHLLKSPVEKKHGGARRKVELPEFDEPVAGPVKCVTEKRKLWSDLTTDKVVKVERIDSHTEHFDAEGYQMTAAEVDEFNVSIGKKVKEPAYRPQPAQMPLTPEDIELTTIPSLPIQDSRRPVPLHGECAWAGCALPALKGEPLCSRHAATHGYSMTGAD